MKITKYILMLAVSAFLGLSLVSCSEDDLGPTIFPDDEDALDPSSYSYKFDKWLQDNFLLPYNLDFRYKMEDVGTDLNYNLVPATFENSQKLAVLVKYLWFDVYNDIVDPEFLKFYGPRIIHIIGSPAYNPTSGTIILGLAEGGIKVSLFRVNDLDLDDMDMLNEYYFKTMHHEFSHILHQTKSYPTEFNLLSTGHYDSSNWQDRDEGMCASLGFFSNYGSSETREDFAETIANYIVKTDDQLAKLYDYAARGWEVNDPESLDPIYSSWFIYFKNEVNDENRNLTIPYAYGHDRAITDDDIEIVTENGVETRYLKNDVVSEVVKLIKNGEIDANLDDWYDSAAKKNYRFQVYAVADKDGIDGVQVLDQKINIAREWFKSAWNADLDALREEVQKRQNNVNSEFTDKLLDQIRNVQ